MLRFKSTVKMASVYKQTAVKVADPRPQILNRQHIVLLELVASQSVTVIAPCHIG